MPTYDYRCDACEHAFEKFQSMSASHLRKCPACGKNKLKRLIGTGAGVIFKGGGFYETDYRSESYKKAADADKPDAGKKSDAKPAKSESKAKTETKPAEPKPTKKPGNDAE
ncbi:MAG: zinc ribbon domain-containing protein [Planctomycetota bacterium]